MIAINTFTVPRIPSILDIRSKTCMTAYLFFFLLMQTSGCVKAESVRFAERPPQPVENVELLPGPPEQPFEVVGRILVEGLPLVSQEYLAQRVWQEAAELGAEAVFLEEVHEHVTYRSAVEMKPDASRVQTGGAVAGASFSASIDTSSTPIPFRPTRRKVAVGVAIVYQK